MSPAVAAQAVPPTAGDIKASAMCIKDLLINRCVLLNSKYVALRAPLCQNFKFGDFKSSMDSKDSYVRQVVNNVRGKVITAKKAKTVSDIAGQIQVNHRELDQAIEDSIKQTVSVAEKSPDTNENYNLDSFEDFLNENYS